MKSINLSAINDHKRNFTPGDFPMAASQVFPAVSGKFVYNNSGAITAAANGQDEIIGAVEFVGTTSSTAGGTRLPIDRSCETIYEVPAYLTSARATLTETVVNALIGKTCDIKVASNVQYADIGAATDDVLLIVGWNPLNNTLLVTMNANELGQQGAV